MISLRPRILLFVLAFLVLVGNSAVLAADKRDLKVGLYQNPPKIFTSRNGEPTGILVDVLDRIALDEGWNIQYVPCQWEDCLSSLRAGRIDLLPDLAYTNERAQQYAFHQVAALHSWSEVYGRQGLVVTSVQDLAGKRIAILRGSSQIEVLKDLLSSHGVRATLVFLDSIEGEFQQVVNGNADVAISNNYFGDLKAPQYGLVPTPIVFQPARLFYAAPKGRHSEVLAAIDRHLATWQSDPDSVYYEILRKWRPETGLAQVPRAVWLCLAAVVGLLLSSLATAVVLRRKVNIQTRDLKQSEQMLSTILDSVSSLIYIKDTDYRYTYVNHAMCELLGKPASSILGKTDVDLFGAETASALNARDRIVIERGERVVAEEIKGDPEGEPPRTFLSTKIPLNGADGRPYALCGISTDITDRKHTEDSLRVAAAVFHSQEGMFVTGPDTNMLDVNAAFTRMTGISVSDLRGKPMPKVMSEGSSKDYWPAIWGDVRRYGRWQGEVWASRSTAPPFPAWLTLTAVQDQDGRTTHYVGTQTDITQRHQVQEQITRLAYYDSLTGLPNRRLLMDRMRQCLSTHRGAAHAGALLFIDLDNFKDLNDTRGHEAGDELLQQVAQRILGCCNETDTVARLGGDEFVVLIEDAGANGVMANEHARALAHKILAEIALPYAVDGAIHRCTCSIGVEVCLASNASVDDLMKRGDLAMYDAKRSGRNTVRFYHDGLEHEVSRRTLVEAELREGLEHGRFRLHFQGQFDLDGKMIGAETLVRWQHPTRGLIGPTDFIGIAEDAGLILPLGEWIMMTACRKLAEWSASALPRVPLAVNVSTRQIREPDFVERTLALLDETGVNPSMLKIELTESTLIEDIDDTIAKMRRLKECGVAFSLDDFGTGYSSLSYLKQLPLDQLKIDRSFVRDVLTDPNDAAIATSIVAMAKALGLGLIAEGVEKKEQRDFLAALGCDAFQGYLYAEPCDEAIFRDLLTKNKRLHSAAPRDDSLATTAGKTF